MGFSKADITREYVEKFKLASKAAIARIMFRDHPLIWSTVAAARSSVNFVTGTMGNKSRKTEHRTDLHRPGRTGNGFPNIPRGLTHFREWAPFDILEARRTLILPDAHIPYHDKRAIDTAIAYGVHRNSNLIIINGDWSDFFSLSFWEKDPRKRKLKNEIDIIRQSLRHVRGKFRKARIVYKIGNHEERWERYLALKAPELLGVEDFELTKILWLDDLGIEVVTDKRPIQLGKLFVIHGHEFKFGITSPVNPARGFYMRAKETCIGSHLHQTSSHSEKSLSGEIISTWSTGCLCDLHPDYSPLNKWNLGFAYVETAGGGQFQMDNRKIIGGRTYRD